MVGTKLVYPRVARLLYVNPKRRLTWHTSCMRRHGTVSATRTRVPLTGQTQCQLVNVTGTLSARFLFSDLFCLRSAVILEQ